ncbi:3-oxo-5-alpha-steroid 4-dehydrogenase 1-like [Saccoglossus kowalevskii]|uniref:3-oxo-5-alpha-steroid 4-dehydrogenase 1-like n=1 Tax=Saccoglossus kowalevskii TaxID=10224 RepID=A0ABM0GRH3_SACKO|nr:PREDICTED: 3-oxo-5-alpha-steroid 4-dehydrogenase 1-like [Saccoglossus kowalevskii]
MLKTIFNAAKETLVHFPNNSHAEQDLLYYMAIIMILCGAMSAVALIFIPSPYGRYSSSVWGPGLNPKMAWFIQELPCLFTPVVMTLYDSVSSNVNNMLLGLFIIHYFHRTLIFPFIMRGGKPTPTFPFLLALFFCSYNGFMQSRTLTQYAVYGRNWTSNPAFIIGGMFQFVSAPNFFGETLEWCGWALACCTLQAVAFAFFTACNVGLRAWQHHRFYIEKFDDYPKSRKAFIPFVF